MQAPTLDSEDRFALSVTGVVHLVLLIFFLIYTFSVESDIRPSFIEVEFGEFQTGKPAEYAKQKAEKVETRPQPSETQPEKPEPEQPEKVEKQQTTTKETTKPVDVPEQTEKVKGEELKTPDTAKIEPQKKTAVEQKKEVTVPPKTEKAEVQQKGAETSGDKKGATGDRTADQGTGTEQEKKAPYELKWEGDIQRNPMVQPLPSNVTGDEATITVRFEVKPDGTVGRIVPLKKMNPELEREVMRTLRSWRFSRLPSGVPQQSQWGTITFRFVLE